MKKIYTILVLIFNLIFRRKYYTLNFIAEVDPPIKRWYYNFKHWGFDHANLEMVSGADTLCEYYAQGNNQVTIKLIATNKLINNGSADDFDLYTAEDIPNLPLADRILLGRTYMGVNVTEDAEIKTTRIWICPVTLFVLGRYPKYLYIKKA